jgi:hypothetical protein
MYQPLDGPSAQIKVSVGTVTAVEVKVGTTPLTDRQVITLQPNGKIKVYFGDGTTPSTATILANGLDHFKDAKESYEVGERQQLFILSTGGTVDVIIVERA